MGVSRGHPRDVPTLDRKIMEVDALAIEKTLRRGAPPRYPTESAAECPTTPLGASMRMAGANGPTMCCSATSAGVLGCLGARLPGRRGITRVAAKRRDQVAAHPFLRL